MKWRLSRFALAFGVSAVCAACTGVLGLDTFSINPNASNGDGAVDAPNDSVNFDSGSIDAAIDSQTCTDPVKQCYSCTPENDTEFLNSCTTGECQPFDRTRILGLLI